MPDVTPHTTPDPSPLSSDSLIASAQEQARTQFAEWLPGNDSQSSDSPDSSSPSNGSPSNDNPTPEDFALPEAGLELEPWREALDVLVDCATQESHLNPAGEFSFELQLTAYLRNRLGILGWARQHPELLREPVAAPVFITGHGRTGTTLLSYLLDQDPDTRSLMGWEAASPLPPPQAETFSSDPRIATAAEMQKLADESRPEMKTIHREAPDGPTECVTLLAQACRSMLFETQWNLPSYGRWYLSRPQLDGYGYHKVALQVLQSQTPGRWMLKSPHHAVATDDILATYPDARFIITHRDPAVSLASVLNLISTFTGWSSDHDWSGYIRDRWLHVWQEMVDRIERTRHGRGSGGSYADRFLDVLYGDLMDDPLRCVAEIYEWLGWELTNETRRVMSEWMADNPQGKHGRHSYHLSDFGFSFAEIDDLFADYVGRHNIPRENR